MTSFTQSPGVQALSKKEAVLRELRAHIPFTAKASILGVVLAYATDHLTHRFSATELSASIFDLAHPIHVLFSCSVSTAMLYKYWKGKRSPLLAIFTGMTIALAIGILSDSLFPYLGSLPFKKETFFYIELFSQPALVLSGAAAGALLGILRGNTRYHHFFHVLISMTASLFYVLSFGFTLTAWLLPYLVAVVFLAVIVPCCVSDIVLPIAVLGTHDIEDNHHCCTH